MEEKTDLTCSFENNISSSKEIETSSSRPTVPDRQAFQYTLREYNQDLKDIAQQIEGIVANLDMLKKNKIEPREKRERLKEEADRMKIEINEIKKQLIEKDALLSDIENDLMYKDDAKLSDRLNVLESAYSQAKSLSNRTEKALVKEIDKLKRNRVKLRYSVVMEEKRAIQLKLRELNERRSVVLRSIREITNNLQIIDREMRKQRWEFLQSKNCLRELYTKKKELVDSYNEQRKKYADWSKSKMRSTRRSSLNYPATYPSAHNIETYDPDDFIDEKTLEPFYEQKLACRRLLEYLTALQSRLPNECSTSNCALADKPSKQYTDNDSGDSAEEYPASFVVLKKQTSLPPRSAAQHELEKDFASASKKKVCKKSSKRPCQKICHPVQMVVLFKETEVPIPHTYREIEPTLEAVQALLKQYQEQTNIIVWEESDYQQLTSLSESEHTTDSAWNDSTDMSEHGSTYSFKQVSSSSDIISSAQGTTEVLETDKTICSNQVQQNLALMTLCDEGFSSKNSTY